MKPPVGTAGFDAQGGKQDGYKQEDGGKKDKIGKALVELMGEGSRDKHDAEADAEKENLFFHIKKG